jgi:hypothetical protein
VLPIDPTTAASASAARFAIGAVAAGFVIGGLDLESSKRAGRLSDNPEFFIKK